MKRPIGNSLPPVVCLLASAGALPALAQEPVFESGVPKIVRITADGNKEIVPEELLGEFEIRCFQRLQQPDPPDELFVMRMDVLFAGVPAWCTEIIVRGDPADLRYYADDSRDRYFFRKLPASELGRFRRFLKERRVHEWADLRTNMADGEEYQFYHFTPRGGRWISINNPPEPGDAALDTTLKPDDPRWKYRRLVALFESLADPEKLQVRYLLSRRVPGLEVLFARPHRRVHSVWAKGDDVRILVDECAFSSQRKWRALVDGRLGKIVETPEGHPVPADSADAADSSTVRLGGLTFPNAAQRDPADQLKPKVETPDGRWLVGIDWVGCLVFIDRKGSAQRRLEAPEGRRYTDMAYVPAHQKILVAHRPDPGERFAPAFESTTPVYELVDPGTGKCKEVEISFNPWFERRERDFHEPQPRQPFLQPTARPRVVWALLAQKFFPNDIIICRYDTRRFRWIDGYSIPNVVFSGGRRIQSLEVESGDMWVDETARKVYLVDRGFLLRVPMPAALEPL